MGEFIDIILLFVLFFLPIIVHNVNLELTIHKPKGNAESGKIMIELNDLHVQGIQTGSNNISNTRDPSSSNNTTGTNNVLSEEDELRALAELINLGNGTPTDLRRSVQTTADASPRGDTTPAGLRDNSTVQNTGHLQPNSVTPSISSTPSPQPPPLTSNNDPTLLSGLLAADQLANQTQPHSNTQNGPTTRSEGMYM